jgi:anti-sigma factor RsiW
VASVVAREEIEMQKINERPVCHRAEDLVTYLYGETSAEEARDFSAHLQRCDACRAEFTVFNQVHRSIVTWRNETIGSVTELERQAAPAREASGIANVANDRRRLSAWAALREFFTVSPLWLRGATAFAGLLLCALIVFAVSRTWQEPSTVVGNDPKRYSERELQAEVERQVAAQLEKAAADNPQQPAAPDITPEPRNQFAARRQRPKAKPANRLTNEEREQLAADLGLIPRREDETPFVLPDEPNY